MACPAVQHSIGALQVGTCLSKSELKIEISASVRAAKDVGTELRCLGCTVCAERACTITIFAAASTSVPSPTATLNHPGTHTYTHNPPFTYTYTPYTLAATWLSQWLNYYHSGGVLQPGELLVIP